MKQHYSLIYRTSCEGHSKSAGNEFLASSVGALFVFKNPKATINQSSAAKFNITDYVIDFMHRATYHYVQLTEAYMKLARFSEESTCLLTYACVDTLLRSPRKFLIAIYAKHSYITCMKPPIRYIVCNVTLASNIIS